MMKYRKLPLFPSKQEKWPNDLSNHDQNKSQLCFLLNKEDDIKLKVDKADTTCKEVQNPQTRVFLDNSHYACQID